MEPAEAHRQHLQRVFLGSLQTPTYLELEQALEGNRVASIWASPPQAQALSAFLYSSSQEVVGSQFLQEETEGHTGH